MTKSKEKSMKSKTRYAYEKRIAELEAEVNRLVPYRETVIEIYQTIVNLVNDDKKISQAWILGRFRWLLK